MLSFDESRWVEQFNAEATSNPMKATFDTQEKQEERKVTTV